MFAWVSIISSSGGTVVFTVCAIAVSFGLTSTSSGSTSGECIVVCTIADTITGDSVGGGFTSGSTSTHDDA